MTRFLARIRTGSSETARRGNYAIAAELSDSHVEVYTSVSAHGGKNRFQVQFFDHRNRADGFVCL